jgi:hypothetical protein
MVFSYLKASSSNVEGVFFFKLALTSMTVIIDDDCDDDTFRDCRFPKITREYFVSL